MKDVKTNHCVNSKEDRLTYDWRKAEMNHGRNDTWNLPQKLDSILIDRNEEEILRLGKKMNKITKVVIEKDSGKKQFSLVLQEHRIWAGEWSM